MLAAVCSISFVNLWHSKAKTYAAWCVRVVKQEEPVENTGDSQLGSPRNSNLYLVSYELLLSEKNMLPDEQLNFTSTGGDILNFMRWEMALRAKHPVISLLSRHCGNMEAVFSLQLNGIMIKGATLQTVARPPLRQACFAYMWCHAKASADEGGQHLVLDSLEVTIKTKLGTYTYSNNTGEADPPSTKVARRQDQVKILDIFEPCDYVLNLGGSDVTVKLIDVPFDCLVVNDECRWNPGLNVFFSALYKKIYGGIYGFKPLFFIAEPSDLTFPTSPFFSSFPNISIEYSPNFKDFSKTMSQSSLAAILTTGDCYKVNNFLLECITGISVPPIPEALRHGTGISWPLGATELNNKLIMGDLPYVHIKHPHVLYIINFKFNTRFCCGSLSGDEIPKLLARYSTGHLKQNLNSWYSYLVFSVMNFCNLHNLQWIAFNHSMFYLASHAQDQDVTLSQMLFNFLQKNLCKAFTFNMTSGHCQQTLATLFRSTLLLSGDNTKLFTPIRPQSWTCVLNYFIYLLCSQVTPETMFKDIVSFLQANGASSACWVLPLNFTETRAPKQQVSRLPSKWKILTADGSPQPWQVYWGIPSCLAYASYVGHLAEIATDWGKVTETNTQELLNHIFDLLRIFF
ncbi:ORF40 [Alcelaphine gammaherpesvirus 1]|nr:ORF40 [Alcelaphine gammaherpesvirus 1]QDY92273.1 helicase-primase subunit [Alcelaphine gammaherpesvirus 1]